MCVSHTLSGLENKGKLKERKREKDIGRGDERREEGRRQGLKGRKGERE